MALYPTSAKSYKSYGTANKGIVKSTEGVVLSLAVCNMSNNVRYLLLYDNTPNSTIVLNEIIPVYPSSGYTVLDNSFFTTLGDSYPNGIAWAWSTTPSVITLASAAECLLKMRYV